MAIHRTPAEKAIHDRIRPLRSAHWKADFQWTRLMASIKEMGDDFGSLELVPDFQRGHVWSEDQQSRFVESCLRGVVSSDGLLIQVNCPNFTFDEEPGDLPEGVQCMDGLQRLTAIDRFVNNEITAFGYTASDLKGTEFCPRRYHIKLAVHTFHWRKDLLDNYLAINAGGTPHSSEEIKRVRDLLADSKAGETATS